MPHFNLQTLLKPLLVSILIPVYNAEKWIADAIRSALAQTWPHTEIIVVNDGSTDETLSVLREFESAKVQIFSQPNRGASAARNEALGFARGDYIQWLDADDLLAPDKIEIQLATLDGRASRSDLLSSAWARFYYRSHRASFVPGALWKDLSPIEWMLGKMENNEWMAIESWLVSRELAESAGLWNTGLSMDDDGEYFSRIILAADRVRFVSEAKSYVRRGTSGSLSKNLLSKDKIDSQFESIGLQISHLRMLEDSPRVRSACLRYLQCWFSHFYPEHAEIVNKARKMASELGGELHVPELAWKYDCLRRLFGWTIAKKARVVVPGTKEWCIRAWDRLLGGLS